MSGYYKLISKEDDLAVVEIAGWDCNGVVLHRKKLEELKKNIEEIQDCVEGEAEVMTHILWEHINSLISQTERR